MDRDEARGGGARGLARIQALILEGGIAGCAAAMELAARGAAVTAVDRDQPGTGATGASAGILSPQLEALGPGHAFRMQRQSMALWPRLAARLEDITGWRVGLRADGLLVANRTRDEEDAALEALAWQHGLGLGGEILSADEAGRVHAGVNPGLPSYVWVPGEAQVDIQRLASALADGTRLEADAVVLAAGVTDEAREYLTEVALELFPALGKARVVEHWAGLRPMTPDAQPIIGLDPETGGLIHATGFGRNGILLAPVAARAVADLALEGISEVQWGPWGVERFG